MAVEWQSATIDGRGVRYLERGRDASRVLTLVHGFPLGARMWLPQLDAFAGYRVIAPSLPGFDGSARVSEPTIEAFARHVHALLDALGVTRSIWCGLSMGGYVTFAGVRVAPERISGVVLADSRTQADTDAGKAARLQMIALARRGGAPAVADDFIPKIVGATSIATRPHVVSTVRELIEAQPVDAIVDATTALMNRPDSAPVMGTISVPTSIIVGEEDTLTPPSDAERMRAGITGATLHVIPGAGHMSNLEAPDAFNAILRAALA